MQFYYVIGLRSTFQNDTFNVNLINTLNICVILYISYIWIYWSLYVIEKLHRDQYAISDFFTLTAECTFFTLTAPAISQPFPDSSSYRVARSYNTIASKSVKLGIATSLSQARSLHPPQHHEQQHTIFENENKNIVKI